MADKLVRIMVSAETAQAVRNLGELAVQSDGLAASSNASMGRMVSGGGGALTKLGTQLGSWGVPFSSSLTNVGQKFDAAGSKGAKMGAVMPLVGVAVGAALVGIGAEAIRMADKFDKATNQIAASAGISQKAAKAIGDAFLNTAGTTIYSGTAIASAYSGVAAQLGATQGKALTSKQAMEVMRAAMDGAAATGQSLSGVTSALANTMQIFGLKASAATSTMNILYEAGLISGTGIDGVTAAVQKMHAQLGVATPPLGQIAGLLDDLKAHGESGRQGLSAVSTGMTTLIKNAQKYNAEDGLKLSATALASKTAFDSLGVTAFNAAGKFEGIRNVIAQLQPKLVGMTQAQQLAAMTTLFGATAAQKMLTTMLAGPAAYDKATLAVNRANTAHVAAQKAMANMGDQMKIIGTAIGDLGTKLGEKLMPVVTSVVTGVTNFTKALLANKPAMIAIGVVVGGVLVIALAAAGVAMWNFAVATIAATWPVLAIIAVVAGLVAGFILLYNHVTGFKDAVNTFVGIVTGAFNDAINFAKQIVGDVTSWIKDHWTTISTDATTAWAVISNIITVAWDVISSIIKVWLVGVIVPLVQGAWTAISTAVAVALAVITPIVASIISIIETIVGAVQNVVSFFTPLAGQIASAVAPIADIIIAPFKAALGPIGAVVGQIASWIGDITGKAAAASVNIGSQLSSAQRGGSTAVYSGQNAKVAFAHAATGGIFTSPTIVSLAENGPEAVVPLTGTGRGAPLPTGGGMGGGLAPIVINVYGNNPQEVVNALRIYNQTRGSIPIRVGG